jgi:hypothetical protein
MAAVKAAAVAGTASGAHFCFVLLLLPLLALLLIWC